MKNAQELGTQVETSLFSQPQATLDPRLFRNGHLISSVRDGILSALYSHLARYYGSAESWTTVWLAGSGVSYQWAAHRDPADLDCLIGVDYLAFRRANEKFARLSDQEIADMLNEGFRSELQPTTSRFLGEYELTFYVNVISDIRRIKPYAAYSVSSDDWTVPPQEEAPQFPKDYFTKAERDAVMAEDIITRYHEAVSTMTAATNPAVRRNAEVLADLAYKQGQHLFEAIHGGRRGAFSPSGGGYTDYANFRWQYAKSRGIVQELKGMQPTQTPPEMPSTSTLIRRAALHYRT